MTIAARLTELPEMPEAFERVPKRLGDIVDYQERELIALRARLALALALLELVTA